TKFFGWLEYGDRSSGDFDWRARPWIAGHTGLSMANFECPEAANLNVLLSLQRFFDGVEEGVHDASAVFLGNHRPSGAGNLGSDSLDQVSFGHSNASCFGRPRTRGAYRT